jgi:hypothetical protein
VGGGILECALSWAGIGVHLQWRIGFSDCSQYCWVILFLVVLATAGLKNRIACQYLEEEKPGFRRLLGWEKALICKHDDFACRFMA